MNNKLEWHLKHVIGKPRKCRNTCFLRNAFASCHLHWIRSGELKLDKSEGFLQMFP